MYYEPIRFRKGLWQFSMEVLLVLCVVHFTNLDSKRSLLASSCSAVPLSKRVLYTYVNGDIPHSGGKLRMFWIDETECCT
ncbi:hypothetical protein B0T09DRAFT_18801 [Sordaria sp. MPI-SDFR-AT-0083]|nr:hypothetical protein B0T09DRAFT_18801 [Sordaria sp. MPI-SDFR-AT-0083]